MSYYLTMILLIPCGLLLALLLLPWVVCLRIALGPIRFHLFLNQIEVHCYELFREFKTHIQSLDNSST